MALCKVLLKMPFIRASTLRKKVSIGNFGSLQVLGTLSCMALDGPAMRVGFCLWKNYMTFLSFEPLKSFFERKHFCCQTKKDVPTRTCCCTVKDEARQGV